jgi:hypothetical protein
VNAVTEPWRNVSPTRLSGGTGPIRPQVVRVIPIEQVLPYDAAWASFNCWRDFGGIMGWRDENARRYDATGGIARVLAVDSGARSSSASGE